MMLGKRAYISDNLFPDYMDQLCGSTLDLTSPRQIYAIRLLLSKNSYYTTDLNCIVHVYAERNEKLLLYFKTMDIYSDCSNTWLELHDGYSVKDHYVPGISNCFVCLFVWLEIQMYTKMSADKAWMILDTCIEKP